MGHGDESPWCPYCAIALTLRWAEGDLMTHLSRYARCQQCQTLFLLTTAGWEDEREWTIYGLEFPAPTREPRPTDAAGSG